MQVNSTWIEIQIHNRYANGTRTLGSKSLVCMLTSARGPFLWSEYMHSVVYNRCVCFLVCDCVCVCWGVCAFMPCSASECNFPEARGCQWTLLNSVLHWHDGNLIWGCHFFLSLSASFLSFCPSSISRSLSFVALIPSLLFMLLLQITLLLFHFTLPTPFHPLYLPFSPFLASSFFLFESRVRQWQSLLAPICFRNMPAHRNRGERKRRGG